MFNIAVIGAGKAAENYVQEHVDDATYRLTFFTTPGEGDFRGQKIQKISDIDTAAFEKVVICSQYVDAILQSLLKVDSTLSNVYIYSVQNNKVDKFDNSILTLKSGPTLYAHYELSEMSLAFNYSVFVNSAQVYADLYGYGKIVFIVTSGRFNHVSLLSASAYSEEQLFWRISNLLPMLSQLAPGYDSFLHFGDQLESAEYLKNKSESDIFPQNAVKKGIFAKELTASYTVAPCLLQGYTDDVQKFVVDSQAMEYLQQGLFQKVDKHKLVTITLRETTLTESRNSDIQAWSSFCRYLIKNGYQPLVLRDTAKALSLLDNDLFEDVLFFPVAGFNVHMRLALYESAFLNMGTDSGATTPTFFMPNTRYCFFFADLEETEKDIRGPLTPKYYDGLKVGENFPFLGKKQKFVWKAQTLENIVQEFNEMVALLND